MIGDAYSWQLLDSPAHEAFVDAYQKMANTHGLLIGYIDMTARIEAIKNEDVAGSLEVAPG
jgi:hypothetical protein